MLPFNLRFRRLLQTFVPKLNNKDLDKHERLVALRHQLIQERNLFKIGSPDYVQIDKQIEKAIQGSNEILEPHKKDFKRVQRLYIDRRRKLLAEKEFQAVPTSPKETWDLVKLNGSLQLRQFIYFWGYLPRKIIHSTISQKVTGTAVTVMLAFSIYLFNGIVKKPSEITQKPPKTTPVVKTQVLPEKTVADVKTGNIRTVITTVTTIETSTQTPMILTATDSTQRDTTKQAPDVAGKNH